MDMEHLLSGSNIAGSRMESYIAVAIIQGSMVHAPITQRASAGNPIRDGFTMSVGRPCTRLSDTDVRTAEAIISAQW